MDDEKREFLERHVRRSQDQIDAVEETMTRATALGAAATEVGIVAALLTIPGYQWQVDTAASVAGAVLPLHVGWWLSSSIAFMGKLEHQRDEALKRLYPDAKAADPADDPASRFTITDVGMLLGPWLVLLFALWSVTPIAAGTFVAGTVYKGVGVFRRLSAIARGRPDPEQPHRSYLFEDDEDGPPKV